MLNMSTTQELIQVRPGPHGRIIETQGIAAVGFYKLIPFPVFHQTV